MLATWPAEPGAGQIAVYDPGLGTATAETAAADPEQIVAAVAARLGYAVAGVRVGRASVSAGE